MDSCKIYKRANGLVRQCGTRDPEKIAKDIGIRIYEVNDLKEQLGMYTCRWNHRLIFINTQLDYYTRQMVLAHEIGHDQEHRDLAKSNVVQEFELFNLKSTTEYEANAFASHILLDSEEVYSCARQGYDVVQIAQMMDSDINLMLIKCYSAHYKALDFLFYLREFSAFRQAPGTFFSVFASHSAELQA